MYVKAAIEQAVDGKVNPGNYRLPILPAENWFFIVKFI
jgi:hypothetical protein